MKVWPSRRQVEVEGSRVPDFLCGDAGRQQETNDCAVAARSSSPSIDRMDACSR